MLRALLLLCLTATLCWAQEKPAIETLSFSITVDTRDGKVRTWLDSLRGREAKVRATLSDSTAVRWMKEAIAADTLGAPLIGTVTCKADSVGGENWLVLRIAAPARPDAMWKMLLAMTQRAAVDQYGAILRPDGGIRMARAMARDWFRSLPREEP